MTAMTPSPEGNGFLVKGFNSNGDTAMLAQDFNCKMASQSVAAVEDVVQWTVAANNNTDGVSVKKGD
jgi:hypothetical protein